ncbi:uncharacterized protein [Typha angustifolia]|uniref:uncharacterized protein n=1 Tax=Typha angustifolia TaxID=59011 RepID=UPI003C2DF77B
MATSALLAFPPQPPLLCLRPPSILSFAKLFISSSTSRRFTGIVASSISSVANSEAASTPLMREIKLEEEIDGGGGGGEGFGGGGSGGSGGDGDGGSGGGSEPEEGGSSEEKEKMGGMSMSQKLTLGYAALVGVGGIIGYVKSGSLKSAAAGGISSMILYYVYTQLPVQPAFASSVGLGISAALLAVMGSRFKKSGKIFPAGVVSLVSFIMVGGYFHGILRSGHV